MHEHSVAGRTQEVVRLQEIQVGRAVVERSNHWYSEEPAGIGALAPRRAGEFDPVVALPLQLVLVPHKEGQVSHVVQHQPVVLLAGERALCDSDGCSDGADDDGCVLGEGLMPAGHGRGVIEIKSG